MTIPVRWFFWPPAAIFGFLAVTFAATTGDALAASDLSRTLYMLCIASLSLSASVASALVASGKTP
jgi:hypothetical protein